MYLKLINDDEVIIYQDIDKTFCHTRTEDGLMTLKFDISPYHTQYKYFEPYTQIEYKNQLYLLTGINERKNVATITCDLDITGLSSICYRRFAWDNISFSEAANEALDGTGWSISGATTITKKSSTDLEDCTPFDILDYFRNKTSYNACFSFDTKSKIVNVIHPYSNTTPSGTYFTDELNLIELVYKCDASKIVTRLLPEGKNYLLVDTVNNGSFYVENHNFTDRVITQTWHDDRYTNAQSLLNDAKAKLAEMAKPEQSYIIKVIDLAKLRPDLYGEVLSYDLYDIVTIIDRRRNKRLDHRIVEIKEYPADPSLNTIVLSTKPLRIKTVRQK